MNFNAIRNRNFWKLAIGFAANLSLPGASNVVAPLLDRYYDGEPVGKELIAALKEYSKLGPAEISTLIEALDAARADAAANG